MSKTTETKTETATTTTEPAGAPKKKRTRKTTKKAAAQPPTVVEQVSANLKSKEEEMTNTAKPVEDLAGEALYSGKFKPADSKQLHCSDDGSIRVMRETWSWDDKDGNKRSSTKIAVRPVYRRRDGNLFFAEPLVNIHENKWKDFTKLMRSIKV